MANGTVQARACRVAHRSTRRAPSASNCWLTGIDTLRPLVHDQPRDEAKNDSGVLKVLCLVPLDDDHLQLWHVFNTQDHAYSPSFRLFHDLRWFTGPLTQLASLGLCRRYGPSSAILCQSATPKRCVLSASHRDHYAEFCASMLQATGCRATPTDQKHNPRC